MESDFEERLKKMEDKIDTINEGLEKILDLIDFRVIFKKL